MNCPDTQARFDDRLDERLPAPARAAFDQHLSGCPTCRHLWQEYAGAWEVVRRHHAPEPSVGFAARVLRRLEAPVAAPTRWPVWRWAVAAGVVVALGLGVWGLHQHRQGARLARSYAEIHQTDYLEDYDVIVWLDQLEGGSSL